MAGCVQDGGCDTAIYEITIRGALDCVWRDWFNGMSVVTQGTRTVLTGRADQAALRGMLDRIWDLNLTLESVRQIDGLRSGQRTTREGEE